MENLNHDNRGPQLLAVNIFFGIVALITVILRGYTRAFIVKAFGADDWLMFAATAVFIAYCCISSAGVYYGTGQHMYNLELENMEKALMFWWLCYLLYSVIVIFIKISFGWFLLRIVTTRLHSWIIYAAALCSILPRIVFFFVALFQCHPVSYFWDRSQPGSCIQISIIMALVYFDSISTIITDFTFAILPAFVIWNLNLRAQARYALIFLVALGCVASAAVVVRLAYTHTFTNPDFLYATTDIAIWSTVEMGLAISAASIATLRPLVKELGWKLGLASSQPLSRSRGPYGNKIPSSDMHKTNGNNRLDIHVLSEFSQGSNKRGGGREGLGTHARAYSSKNMMRQSYKEANMDLDNESQEQLNDP
ncbi:hypothetical protein TrVFT333_010689 [Trichoderma virens FT-333]|nr:hypothetical protein TrVFT333_010689 [Trichoderma virens FT-333]